MEKENLIRLIKFIENLDIEGENSILNIDDYCFNQNQLKAIFTKLLNAQKILERFDIVVKENLSMRRALIVILQEKYYPLKTYDEIDVNLSQLINQAKVRFQIENRSISKLNTPQTIHPKNPCKHYEDNPLKKEHYKKALKLLVNPSKLFFEDVNAFEDLIAIYEDLLIC